MYTCTRVCYTVAMEKQLIEYSGAYKVGSKLKRVIISHFDEGKRLLGRYEVWMDWDAVLERYGTVGWTDEDLERTFAIAEFEELLKINDEKDKKYTGVYVPYQGEKYYGDSKEFPGVIDNIDPNVRTNISVPKTVFEWLRLESAKENSSISEVVIKALQKYKEQYKPGTYKGYQINTWSEGFEVVPGSLNTIASFIIRWDKNVCGFAFAVGFLTRMAQPEINDTDLISKALSVIKKNIDKESLEHMSEYTYEYQNDEFIEVQNPKWWKKTSLRDK